MWVTDKDILHDWLVLLGSVLLLWNAISGVTKKRVAIFHTMANQADNPPLYWTGVITSGILGVAGVVLAVLLL